MCMDVHWGWLWDGRQRRVHFCPAACHSILSSRTIPPHLDHIQGWWCWVSYYTCRETYQVDQSVQITLSTGVLVNVAEIFEAAGHFSEYGVGVLLSVLYSLWICVPAVSKLVWTGCQVSVRFTEVVLSLSVIVSTQSTQLILIAADHKEMYAYLHQHAWPCSRVDDHYDKPWKDNDGFRPHSLFDHFDVQEVVSIISDSHTKVHGHGVMLSWLEHRNTSTWKSQRDVDVGAVHLFVKSRCGKHRDVRALPKSKLWYKWLKRSISSTSIWQISAESREPDDHSSHCVLVLKELSKFCSPLTCTVPPFRMEIFIAWTNTCTALT